MKPKHYLAIDQGGHATRAIVFDSNGTALGEHSIPITTNRPSPDRVEHDAEEMAQSVHDAVAGLAAELGSEAKYVVAAGFATQRSSVAFWDRDSGEALAPIASWQDRRAADELQSIASGADAEIARITGLRVSPHYGANKLRWFLENHSKVMEAASAGRLCCGPLASYLLARSLRESPCYADPANASRTLLWDVHTKDWSEYLTSLFRIPRAVLPQAVPSRFEYGTLALGEYVVPVTVCTGDQSAAIFAAGALDEEAAYVNIGTGAFIQKPTRRAHPQATPLLQSVVWDDGHSGLRVLEGTINGAAGALVEYIEPEAADWSSKLNAWLQTVENPPLFLNGVSGLAAPFWVPDFQSCFLSSEGARTEPGIDARAVAVAESVVFLLQENVRVLQEKGEPVERFLVTGGLANHDELCKRLANLSGCEVLRARYSEATARGLCYLLRSTADTSSAEGSDRSHSTANEESWQAAAGEPDRFVPEAAPGLHKRYERWHTELMQRIAPPHGQDTSK